MRILHVWQPAEAGVQIYASGAARFQAEKGWDIHVACPNPPPMPGVTAHLWTAERSPIRGLRSESRSLQIIVDEVDPDVVVAHSSKAGMVVRGMLRGSVSTVFLPHAWSAYGLPRPLAPAAIAWERLAARWTNAIVAGGEREAEAGVAFGIRAPMFVVRNPVREGWQVATEEERASARTELGLGSQPVVVCLGRLAKQKGQDVLLQAWESVSRAAPEAVLILVGDGPDAEELKANAPRTVVFAGATDDPRPYLAACDISVVPSRWETFSLSMLEGMATGRSSVVTDVSGGEAITNANAGAKVAIDDVDALAAELTKRVTGQVDLAAEGRRAHEYTTRFHDYATQMTRLSAVVVRAHAFGR